MFLAFMAPQHLNRLRLLPDSMLIDQNPASHFDPAYLNMVHSASQNDEFLKFPSNEENIVQHINNMAGDPEFLRGIKQLIDKRKLSSYGGSEDTTNNKLHTMFNYAYPNVTDNMERMQNYQRFKVKSEVPSPVINEFDLSLLLRLALTKIPQIPFEGIIDTFRWDLFLGDVPMDEANNYFWHLVTKVQGIFPPEGKHRGGEIFDAGAKFHVADNTPFVR